MTPRRVGLQEYELRGWIERLRSDKRAGKSIAGEIERAVEAAIQVGLVISTADDPQGSSPEVNPFSVRAEGNP